ncbi:hypothetical protein HRI96_06000 [Treponema parvum]|uniref:P83/100 protein n=1 Tax=Treponema parvum TaxID=138851 RepID=A0A975EZS5_9SPIR|nr:P83/100 family protein [Treponema parvum]QTQ11792.1 hypothetical protein HRI96_06000 [Treponema parvum]
MKNAFQKIVFLCAVVLINFSMLFALEVNRDEITSTRAETVIFENYTGPHSVIESVQAIKNIGRKLGNSLSNPAVSARIGSGGRYYVIHAVDSNVKEKFDADIFVLEPSASVDHIANLRRIISSYLSSAYNYSESDADTLSVFITVYNAVYRGKIDFFKSKYKDVVTKELTPEKAGLALSYTQWPGMTQIVIPLSDPVSGGLSTVDTSAISDSNVVSSMREESDKGIDVRKNMVEIKEKEAAVAEEKAQAAQKQAVEGQKQLKADQEKLAEQKKEAEKAQKKAEAAPGNKNLQKEAKAAEQKVAQTERKIEEQKQKIEENVQKAETEQKKADTKNSEAVTERETIAKDQQQLINAMAANENVPSAYALRLYNEAKRLSVLVKVNKKTGEIINESPVTVIRNRAVYPAGENFTAIAGENTGNGIVKLVLLDKEKMEITAESQETVAEDSVLVEHNNELYCVLSERNKFYVARYNKELKLLAKSSTAVKSGTPITVDEKTLYVTDESGKIALLSASDLKPVK